MANNTLHDTLLSITNPFCKYNSNINGIWHYSRQGNISSLTPQQKAAMCNPSDTFVNDNESRICGVPPTPTNTTSSSPKTSSP